jgi:hypothetical protein
VNPPLTGALAAGMMTTAPGKFVVPLTVHPNVAPVYVKLIGAKVQILAQGTDARLSMLKIGGAISQAELDATVIPAMRDGFMASVTHDCSAPTSPPLCGCAAGSARKTARSA